MSRRQSRVSTDTRQNDTLLEFETFKKKFLLANKHITKLNSTLSVRIEELNAQISTLYVENLRLRASEIALTSQLKKEREKSRKILGDAEAAAHALLRQLGHVRKSYHVSRTSSSPEPDPAPPLPRAQRPVIDPNASPPPNRIARPPTIPGIFEEEEEEYLDPDDPRASPTPPRRKSRSRPSSSAAPSSSRLPQPTRTSTPLFDEHAQYDFEQELNRAGKKKPTRRQSGLITTSMSITTVTPNGFKTELLSPRPPSPAFGSPLRREAALREEEDEMRMAVGADEPDGDEDDEPVVLDVARRKRKSKEKESEMEPDVEESGRREREKRRSRDADGDTGRSSYEGKKPKLKDVTNAPPPRPSLANIDSHDRERQRTPSNDAPTASTSTSHTTSRTFLATPAPQPLADSYLPSPRSSSPPVPADSDPLPAGARERRVRKSINYAEPKLNTKMRKPDPPAAPPSTVKRTSSGGADSTVRRSLDGGQGTTISSGSAEAGPSSQAPPQPLAGVKRKKSRVYVAMDDAEESEGTQADGEYGGSVRSATTSAWVNADSRRKSVAHTSTGARRTESDDLRRHSLAV